MYRRRAFSPWMCFKKNRSGWEEEEVEENGGQYFFRLRTFDRTTGKEKGIERNVVIEAIEQGMELAARKKYGTYREIEAKYNEEVGEVELFEFKEVVEDDKFIDEEVEIKMSEALELDPEAQLNDSIGRKLESGDLGRIAAQTAKQIIMQKVREAERDIIFASLSSAKARLPRGSRDVLSVEQSWWISVVQKRIFHRVSKSGRSL